MGLLDNDGVNISYLFARTIVMVPIYTLVFVCAYEAIPADQNLWVFVPHNEEV